MVFFFFLFFYLIVCLFVCLCLFLIHHVGGGRGLALVASIRLFNRANGGGEMDKCVLRRSLATSEGGLS